MFPVNHTLHCYGLETRNSTMGHSPHYETIPLNDHVIFGRRLNILIATRGRYGLVPPCKLPIVVRSIPVALRRCSKALSHIDNSWVCNMPSGILVCLMPLQEVKYYTKLVLCKHLRCYSTVDPYYRDMVCTLRSLLTPSFFSAGF